MAVVCHGVLNAARWQQSKQIHPVLSDSKLYRQQSWYRAAEATELRQLHQPQVQALKISWLILREADLLPSDFGLIDALVCHGS